MIIRVTVLHAVCTCNTNHQISLCEGGEILLVNNLKYSIFTNFILLEKGIIVNVIQFILIDHNKSDQVLLTDISKKKMIKKMYYEITKKNLQRLNG